MFKCEVTGKITKSGEKMTKVVVQTRDKEYLRDGVVIGEGYETVRELSCSAEGATLWPTLSTVQKLQIMDRGVR